MNMLHLKSPASSPEELEQIRKRVWQIWQDLPRDTAPFNPAENPDLLELIDGLRRLKGVNLLQLQEFRDFGRPVQAIALVDLNDDAQKELLVVTQDGQLRCYTVEGSALAAGELPLDSGRVIGIEVHFDLHDQIEIPYIITEKSGEQPQNQIFEVVLRNQELTPYHNRRRRVKNQTATSARYGKLHQDGLAGVTAVSHNRHTSFELRGVTAFGRSHTQPLTYRPFVIVHTAERVWLGDSQEKILCWRWSENGFETDAAWPAEGLPVDGRITALALWQTQNAWILLIATDERQLLVADSSGRLLHKAAVPHVITALAPVPAENLLWIAAEDESLTLARPLNLPLSADPDAQPTLRTALDLLPTIERDRLLDKWLAGGDTAVAVKLLLAYIPAQPEWAYQKLRLINDLDPASLSPNIATAVIQAAETTILNAAELDMQLVESCLHMAQTHYARSAIQVQRRIDLLTARLSAFLGQQITANPDYQWLSNARRRGDLAKAHHNFEQGKQDINDARSLEIALNIYAKVIIHRRQVNWTFGDTASIRVLAALPDSSYFLLANRNGDLYLLNLETRKLARRITLPGGAIPRTAAIGPLVNTAVPSLALVTADGVIYVGPATPEQCLLELKRVGQVDEDVWSMALYPAQETAPPQLIISCRGGRLIRFYSGQADGWQTEPLPSLDAGWLSTVRVATLADGEAPVILAGGGKAGAQGILHLLNQDGSPRCTAIHLESPVLDVRAVRYPGLAQKTIAVACANGSLYLVSPSGVRLWRYRVGRAARSLSVCDIDEDGIEEIIVGGERPQEIDADRHLVMVLGARGEIQWVIPAQAAVTHVATLRTSDRQPQLLIGDLGQTVQVVAVNPPGYDTENEILQRAEACLELLAARRQTTPGDLALRWLHASPDQLHYLQAYAFHYCAQRAAAGDQQALDSLLAVQLDATNSLMHRAYARSLVYLATHSENHITRQVLERLEMLFDDESTYREAGIATMRALMLPNTLRVNNQLPNNVPQDTLETWTPLLIIAAQHPQAEVQRAVLYALRALLPQQTTEELQTAGNLPSKAWKILNVIAASESDEDAWVYEAAAALLRDLNRRESDLWSIVHQALIKLDALAPRILNFLGRSTPPFLENRRLACAIETLVQLYEAQDGSAALTALTALSKELEAGQFAANGDDETTLAAHLNEMYQLMGQGAALPSYKAWVDFISDRLEVNLRRLAELAQREPVHKIAGNFEQELNRVRDILTTFRDQTATAVTVRRLLYDLREQSEIILNPAPTATATSVVFTASSPLSKALVGMLYAWYQEESILSGFQELLNRPAQPELEAISAILQYDEVQVEAYVWNPGQGLPLQELNIRLPLAKLQIEDLTLDCQAEQPVPKNLNLAPQEKQYIRFRVSIPTDQRTAVANLRQNKAVEATLQVPVHYFLNGETRRKPLTCPVSIQISTRASLDFEHDLPRAWRTASAAIQSEFRPGKTNPVKVIAAPLIRNSIIRAIRRCAARAPQPPIVDWRAWLDQIFVLRQSGLHTEEGPLLQWLSQQIWPQFVDVSTWRSSLAPRAEFKALLADPLKNNPEMVIFNHWDRLLASISRRNYDWHPLDTLLPFLVQTLQEAGIRPVFVGNYLSSEIMRTLWPATAAVFTSFNANHVDIGDAQIHTELVQTLEKMLAERELNRLLRYFPDSPTLVELVDLSRGYLAFFEFVLLPALDTVRQEAPVQYLPLQEYLLAQVEHNNFFALVWAWQSFFERITLALSAHSEIPLERRNHAAEDFVLSRDYYARRPDGRPVPRVTFPAGTRLTEREVRSIHSNEYYRAGDVWIRGFDPRRPAPKEWGAPGNLFMQLFSAGKAQTLLQRMENNYLLRSRKTKHVASFYELAIPLHEAWLQRTKAWAHMQSAAQSAQNTWYPHKMAQDQRRLTGKTQATIWLFPARKPGLAFQDIPIDVIQEVDRHLSQPTKPLFFNLFGLAGKDKPEADRLWNSLVTLAQTNNALQGRTTFSEADHAAVRDLFYALSKLLEIRLVGAQPRLDQFGEQFLPWSPAEISGDFGALHKRVMLALLRDGRFLSRDLYEFRDWTRTRLSDRYEDHAQDIEALNRSVVVVIVLQNGERLKQTSGSRDGGPHFVFLDVPQLTSMALQPDPQRQLINHAFNIVGRHSFTPYRLAGSLAAGSPLFVGRASEISTVLSSLDTQDHAILGSRRIGKTSLLKQIHYRLLNRSEHEKLPVLFIQLQDRSRVQDFYRQVKRQLHETGHPDLAQQLSDTPAQDYADLYAVFQALKQQYNHPVIILMDEIDDLYLYDLRENNEQLFQFFRNQLAQSTPRVCTFVMTGFRHIYLNRLRHGSVFYNFCRFHNLVGVGRSDVARLVRMLKEFSLEIQDEDEVIGMVAQGTYAIPYYVQLVCDDLLSRVDRRKQDFIGANDVQAVLQGNLKMQLKRELWDDLDVDPLLSAMQVGESRPERQQQMVKARIMLLTTILTRYQHKFNATYSQAMRAEQEATFTAVDALRFLHEFDLDLGAWQPSEAEIDRLLRSMTMTLALAPVSDRRSAYIFPNDILPDVLFYHHQRGAVDLVDELMRLVEELKRFR